MKQFIKLGKFFLSGYFAAISGIASVVGLLLIFLKDPWALIFALTVSVAMMIVVFIKLTSVLNSFMSNKTKNGFLSLTTHSHYSTIDGNHVHYELHKCIQCKQLIMDNHLHEFNWTGTILPSISSTQQDYVQTIPPATKGQMYQAVLKFRRPLIYNDISVIEIIMDMDDTNHRSSKRVGHNIHEAIHLITFVVELKHLSKAKDAKICREVIVSLVHQEAEIISYVPFDTTSRSYRYNLFSPEPGYNYRLSWE